MRHQPLGLIRAFIRHDSGSAAMSVGGDSKTYFQSSNSLVWEESQTEECEFHKLLSWASSVDLTCWAVILAQNASVQNRGQQSKGFPGGSAVKNLMQKPQETWV